VGDLLISPGVAPGFPLLGHGTCHWVHREGGYLRVGAFRYV